MGRPYSTVTPESITHARDPRDPPGLVFSPAGGPAANPGYFSVTGAGRSNLAASIGTLGRTSFNLTVT